MKSKYVVLGAGRQGTAIAYDLACFGEASAIQIFDQDQRLAQKSARRVNQLSDSEITSGSLLDVGDRSELSNVLKGIDVCVSAVPYKFNASLTESAIQAGAHFCDLGGNTDIVREQIGMASAAKKAGVSVVPDCGLAPGMANSLALYILERLNSINAAPRQIKMYCGGLPQNPQPPLGYQMLFSMDGLINEYDSLVYSLRNGKVRELEPLTELEAVEFPLPIGRCEAFLTSGGTSTAPWRYEKSLQAYEYKTVRYPGHCEKIKAIRDLGMWESGQTSIRGTKVAPRVVFAHMAGSRLEFPDARDLVVLRVQGIGEEKKSKRPIKIQLDLIDYFDPVTGFTAMERTTGFPTAIVAILQAQGAIKPGANPPDPSVPAKPFVAALLERGFDLRETVERPLNLKD
ncbi:saccharopine dehydrogenase NADP-binding domain-containing protein [Candidatus Acetothermia bacterium]|nr:saccharopine dehydrogenase NADP-binding domain-containing protein [Candidatus Acetothermia bacterium]MBI3644106.1 saccharopine dehydrogenase NADP-binding domain-containing protein [Candidatus Acetothermia bacterium]